MTESERDDDSVFTIPQPLVPDSENHRTYIFQISDDEGEEDRIEKLYGPFENIIDTTPPYPKTFSRNAKNAELVRNEQILKLREAIKDRETKLAQNMLNKRKQEIKTEWNKGQPLSFPENQQRRENINHIRRNNVHSSNVTDRATKPAPPPETIVIDSDSDENMETAAIGSPTSGDSDEIMEATVIESPLSGEASRISISPLSVISVDEVDELIEELSELSEIDEALNVAANDSGDSDTNSFHTAYSALNDSDDIDAEIQQTQAEQAATQEEIRNIKDDMEARSALVKEIKVKLLGIQVKLSIEKNRREMTKKSTTTTPPLPQIGRKRPNTDEQHFVNQNSWRPTTPTQPPFIPTITTHDISSSSSMAFSQQIPPYIQQFTPLPPLPLDPFNTRYNPYANPFAPPPPPPDTMPPVYIPPPPPPVAMATPYQQVGYKRSRHANRQKDAWLNPSKPNKRFAAAASPYADLSSPISRIENADELQAALLHVSELISVRIFGDEKHNQFPANVERALPISRRLVTVDKRSSASSTNDSELESIPKAKITFISPVALPVQIGITDACHESTLLNLLYRQYRSKPFSGVMQFAVPSILSWIPTDVDLSTLYSNEFGGIPLYADKLKETYNMVRDLLDAYPTTEFFAALKLELSMYVNGRQSEHFLRDCQDCATKFPDSIDVFWQIVLAEQDQAKQLALIQGQLKSIRLSSSTVTMVSSEKSAEILIRTIRLFGLGQVLSLLSDGKITGISDTEGGIILLDQIQYVNDDGKYFIWMSILHYYVTNTLPVDVCDIWMCSLVRDGTPSREKPLFTIDWGNALKNHPVDRSTLRGATNILLSMLRYFGNSAIGNVNKKPLLVGVLSTLFSFLSFTKCYEVIGTVVLTQQLNSPAILRDIEEIRMNLTSKTDV